MNKLLRSILLSTVLLGLVTLPLLSQPAGIMMPSIQIIVTFNLLFAIPFLIACWHTASATPVPTL